MGDDFVWRFTILGKPISQKNSKRVGITKGGKPYMYTAANVKKWRKSAVEQLKEQLLSCGYPPLEDKTEMEITVMSYLGKGQSLDSDNLSAGPLDAMEEAGVYGDDYWGRRIISDRDRCADNPRVEIEIRMYGGKS